MKATTMYECEVCGKIYDNQYECKECERKHIKPIEIVASNAQGELFDYYPSFILIKFDNGAIRKYCFDIKI